VRTLDALLLRLVDAESGARGWVATGDARFLEPTRRARAEVAWSVDALRRLAAADAAQVERVQVLAARAEAALDHVDGSWRGR
jgi:methyl-accepting chemotaxis protein